MSVSTATSSLSETPSPFRSFIFLCSIYFPAFTGGAALRPAGSERKFPGVLAILAPEFSRRSHLKLLSFNLQGFAINQSIRHLLVSRFDNSPKCLPRYIHLLCSLFLVQTSKVSQPNRLQFIQTEDDLIENSQGNSPRLKIIGIGFAFYAAAFLRSRHASILSICS